VRMVVTENDRHGRKRKRGNQGKKVINRLFRTTINYRNQESRGVGQDRGRRHNIEVVLSWRGSSGEDKEIGRGILTRMAGGGGKSQGGLATG